MESQPKADEVRIEVVTDDGIGVCPTTVRSLMEPYVTHKPKGTGLGLAIVKKIMEDHGGRITLDDRADGPGADRLPDPARAAYPGSGFGRRAATRVSNGA